MRLLFVTCYEPKEHLVRLVDGFVEIGYRVDHYPLFKYQHDRHDALINWREHFHSMIEQMVPDIILWTFINVTVEDFKETAEYAREVWQKNATCKQCATFTNAILSFDEPTETWEALRFAEMSPCIDIAFSSCPENCRKFLSCGAGAAFHTLPGVDVQHVLRNANLAEADLWKKLRYPPTETTVLPVELVDQDESVEHESKHEQTSTQDDLVEELREYFNVEPKYHCDIAFVCQNLWLDDDGPLLGTSDIPEEQLIGSSQRGGQTQGSMEICRQLVPRVQLLDLLCGKLTPDRLQIQKSRLDSLIRRGTQLEDSDFFQSRYALPTDEYSIAIYGPGFLGTRYPRHYKGYPKYEDRWQIALGARVVVCTHSDAYRANGLYVDQDFLLAQGFGGLVLCDPVSQLRSLFRPSVQVFPFRSLEPRSRFRSDGTLRSRGDLLLDVCEEIASKVQWSLANPKESFTMRQHAQKNIVDHLSTTKMVKQMHTIFLERATDACCKGADHKSHHAPLARCPRYREDAFCGWQRNGQVFLPEVSNRFNAYKYYLLLEKHQIDHSFSSPSRPSTNEPLWCTCIGKRSSDEQILWEHWIKHGRCLDIALPRTAGESLLDTPTLRSLECKKSQRDLSKDPSFLTLDTQSVDSLDLSSFERLACERSLLEVFSAARGNSWELGDALNDFEKVLCSFSQTSVAAQHALLGKFFFEGSKTNITQ